MYDMPCPAESGVLVLALNNGNNFQLDYLSATLGRFTRRFFIVF
jgi:hypothetical protein